MAYMNFQSERADYVFNGTNHIFSRRKKDTFNGIEALVVEGGADEEIIMKNSFLEQLIFVSIGGNKSLAKQVREENIPIYIVDVKATVWGIFQDFLLSLPWDPFYLPISAGYSLSKKEIPQRLQRFLGYVERKINTGLSVGRNVIAAEKIEGYLVERIAEEKKILRPRIGIVYGMDHTSIIDFLVSEELRKETLERHRKSNFRGLKKDEFDSVLRYSYVPEEGYWKKSVEHTGLFKT